MKGLGYVSHQTRFGVLRFRVAGFAMVSSGSRNP